jgi:hypothetical protein
MSIISRENVKNIHLKLSILLILVIALVYGIDPSGVLPKLFDFAVPSSGLKNVFRSMMGLYLSMCLLWSIGIVNRKYWLTATITNVFFMGGLAAGRLISILMDGYPGIYFFTGFFIELVMALWGGINLNRFLKAETI